MLNLFRSTLACAPIWLFLATPAAATHIDPDSRVDTPEQVTLRDATEVGSRDLARTLRVSWADETSDAEVPAPRSTTRTER